MRKLSLLNLLFGPWLAFSGAFAGQKSRSVAPDEDPRDKAFCQFYLGGPDASLKDRFADIDPLTHLLDRLVDLRDRGERTTKSLNQSERIRLMADVRLHEVIGFVREHAGRPMPLDQVYGAYLETAWLRLAQYVRTENPSFFAEGSRPAPHALSVFQRSRMLAFREKFPRPVDVGPVFDQLLRWLPNGPGDRLRALYQLTDVAHTQSILGDLLLGGDPVAALRNELREGRGNAYGPDGIGALRERIFAEYADLKIVIKALGKVKGKTLVDLSAGIGRVGFALAASKSGVRYLGYERVGARVTDGERMAQALGLKPSDWHLIQMDVTAPGFVLPSADLYYVSNAFLPGDLDRLYEKLGERARDGRPFTLIMGYEPLFQDAAKIWPKHHSHAARIFPPLPPWLHLEEPVHLEGAGYDATFYILSSKTR